MLRALALPFAAALVLGLAACGGGGAAKLVRTVSATDSDSGVTVSVAGTKVTVTRSKTSTAGTGNRSGQVACVDDYAKLAVYPHEPPPSLPWYAATLLTWPAKGQSTTATLSHALSGPLDLCVAEMSDETARAIVFFHPGVRAGLYKLQQSVEPQRVLMAAASLALATVYKNAFPSVRDIVSALNSQNLYVLQTPTKAGVTQTGAVYVISSETTPKKLVAAIKGSNGKVLTVTQGVTGQPKLG